MKRIVHFLLALAFCSTIALSGCSSEEAADTDDKKDDKPAATTDKK